MAQLNPLVGDISGNRELIAQSIAAARDEHRADVIVFGELCLCGYPPQDLLLKPSFVDACERALDTLPRECNGVTAIVGAPRRMRGELFNTATVMRDGEIIAVARKQCLPNYGVFEERRYFAAGKETLVCDLPGGLRAGVTVCEDVWSTAPIADAARRGAEIIINLNASPFHSGKLAERRREVATRVDEHRLPVVYVNQVGGQDELVFDGGSFVMDGGKRVAVQTPLFQSGLYPARIEKGDTAKVYGERAEAPVGDELIYEALVYGVRDYVGKNGFRGALLGLSGGIDSALTLCIAVDALGGSQVTAVMMPFKHTSAMSIADARAQARALGVEYHVIPIAPAIDGFGEMLADVFKGAGKDTTEENLQSRARGVVLMALSNKLGKIVLATGNKSEMATGYATLYGDMAGGFAPLKDVYKTMVYRLARCRNRSRPVIPQRVIDRPPSAELAADQLDSDSLPDYDTLDAILEQYIEADQDAPAIAAMGHDAATVAEVIGKVERNEYKRRQAPPGIKITARAFGRDRRYPITAKK